MTIRPLIALTLTFAFAATSAMAADIRSSAPAHKIAPRGVTSMVSASQAAPVSRAGTQQADSLRGSINRKARQDAMMQKLIKERRALMGAAALAAEAATALPHVAGSPISGGDGFGFKGLSNVDQASVNQGFSVEPPDQALCVGNGFVMEGVNDAFAIYDEHGATLVGPVQANAFFGVPFELNVSDPRCLYDKASDRWFVTMIEYPNDFSHNHLEIAVSQTGDPTGTFNLYDIDVTHDGSDILTGDCPCLGDQPLIGADAYGFYISTNSFGVRSFEGAQIYVLSKQALASGGPAPATRFDQLTSRLPGMEIAASIQPSITPPDVKFAPDTEFFAQSMGLHKLESQLAVWALHNTSKIDTDPDAVTMSLAVIPSEVYVLPVPADQKAGRTPRAEAAAVDDAALGSADVQDLDGNDQRLQQVMYRDGQLWTALGTASVGDNTPIRDAVAWFVINASSSAKGATAQIAAQGYVAGAGNSHLLYPAVAVNAAGEAAMVFTLTGPEFFPSAAAWEFGDHSVHMLFRGQAAQDGASAYSIARPRWGDYSAAAVGPHGRIWLATEMIPGGVRKRSANWGTFLSGDR